MTFPPVPEDHWTRPSPWCPRPGRWHADTADATEHEVTTLITGFTVALQPETVVETGTNSGQTALAIALALASNGHGHLWTLETDEVMAAGARDLLAGLPATVVHGSSLDWDPPRDIDLAWLDSGPVTGTPGQDPGSLRCGEIARWRRRFTPGAIIGVHDTGPQHPVMRMLGPLLAGEGIPFLNLRTPRGVVLAQVP